MIQNRVPFQPQSRNSKWTLINIKAGFALDPNQAHKIGKGWIRMSMIGSRNHHGFRFSKFYVLTFTGTLISL